MLLISVDLKARGGFAGGEMQGKWEKAAPGLAKQCDIPYTPWEHLQMERRIKETRGKIAR